MFSPNNHGSGRGGAQWSCHPYNRAPDRNQTDRIPGVVFEVTPAHQTPGNGRRKQLIVRDGSNISHQEVGDALLEHPAVAIVGVVGVPRSRI